MLYFWGRLFDRMSENFQGEADTNVDQVINVQISLGSSRGSLYMQKNDLRQR